MKLNKNHANCRVRRYLLIFTALSLLLLPLSLIYLVWNEQLQKIKGYEVSVVSICAISHTCQYSHTQIHMHPYCMGVCDCVCVCCEGRKFQLTVGSFGCLLSALQTYYVVPSASTVVAQ